VLQGFFQDLFYVEEELPLKQGLKLPLHNTILNMVIPVEEELPLKQGLKHVRGLYAPTVKTR